MIRLAAILGMVALPVVSAHAQIRRPPPTMQEECPQGQEIRQKKRYPASMTDCEVLDVDTRQIERRGPQPAPRQAERPQDPFQNEIDGSIKAGYSIISFDDFELDAKQLVASGKKVAIMGYVRRIGEVETLFPTEMKAFYVGQAPTAQIPLLADDSPRETRAYFLKCFNTGNRFGCRVRVLGHAEVCKFTTTMGQSVPTNCLIVEGSWTPKDD